MGPVRAEWGWGVGNALGFNEITLRLGPGYKDRPSGAGVGPVRAEGRLGLSGVGEGLGMRWDSIKLL